MMMVMVYKHFRGAIHEVTCARRLNNVPKFISIQFHRGHDNQWAVSSHKNYLLTPSHAFLQNENVE